MTGLDITLLALLAAAVVTIILLSRNSDETLSVSLGSDFRKASTERNTTSIAAVQGSRTEFFVAYADQRDAANPSPLKAILITGARPSVQFVGMVAAVVRGQYGTAETHTVRAYASSTTFGIVTTPEGVTYVAHFDHKPNQRVEVTILATGEKQCLDDASSFFTIKQGVFSEIMTISSDTLLTGLEPDVAKLLRGLRDQLDAAGVKQEPYH